MNDRFGTRVSKILCMDIFFVGVSIFLTHPYVYAIDSYNSESIFLSVAPIVTTEIFDNLPANSRDGFFNASFDGIVYEGEGKLATPLVQFPLHHINLSGYRHHQLFYIHLQLEETFSVLVQITTSKHLHLTYFTHMTSRH